MAYRVCACVHTALQGEHRWETVCDNLPKSLHTRVCTFQVHIVDEHGKSAIIELNHTSIDGQSSQKPLFVVQEHARVYLYVRHTEWIMKAPYSRPTSSLCANKSMKRSSICQLANSIRHLHESNGKCFTLIVLGRAMRPGLRKGALLLYSYTYTTHTRVVASTAAVHGKL
jgi:hypothetical protein